MLARGESGFSGLVKELKSSMDCEDLAGRFNSVFDRTYPILNSLIIRGFSVKCDPAITAQEVSSTIPSGVLGNGASALFQISVASVLLQFKRKNML